MTPHTAQCLICGGLHLEESRFRITKAGHLELARLRAAENARTS